MKITSALLFILFVNYSFSQCWQKIASNFDHALAIHEDGTLWTWGGAFSGYRSNNYPVQVGDDTDWVSISVGFYTNAAIKSDGTLWMWGENGFGQLGQGNQTNLWVPTQVGTDNNWLQISCGYNHTSAIKTDGTLWLWGRNDNGQIGAGLNRASRLVPTQLGTETNWIEISAGRNHTLIRNTSNAIWFVGACYSATVVSQLRQVGSALDWKTMGAGAYTDYAIKQNGTLWKWGNSNGGSSGLAQVSSQTNWDKIGNYIAYSTEAHTLFIKTDGTLWGVGVNNFGQLGIGNTTNVANTPVQIGTETDWKQVVAGALYSLALKTDNSFWAWGRNQHAQFGNGENKNQIRNIDPNTQWKEVVTPPVSFNGHTLAIQENGTLWSWGPNQDGQLGVGAPAYGHRALPVQVGTENNWKSVSNGFHFSVGVKDDGTVWGWGRNSNGQAGLGNLTTVLSPIQIGTDSSWIMTASSSSNTIAIKSDGTLWAWGNNQFGELGTGNTTQSKIPIQIGIDNDWEFVAAGNQHSMAIKTDGSLWSWGNNNYGQLGRSGNTNFPTRVGTDSWLKVIGGGFHTLGVKSDSTLWSWGRNLYSQLGDGTTSNKSTPYMIDDVHKWVDISAGYEHSLALTNEKKLWGWGRNAAGNLNDSLSYVQFLSSISIPKQLHPDSKWNKISAGVINSVIIDEVGKLYTFGDSYSQDSQSNFPQLGYIYSTPQRISICNNCPVTSSQFSQSICQGDSIFFNNEYFLLSGSYNDTLTNFMGCDSIVTLNLTVHQPIQVTDIHVACDSFVWIDGNVYTEDNNSAVYIYENGASNGCDSIVTLNLTVYQPIQVTDIHVACDSFVWIDGNIYTEDNNSAVYIYENGASNGCDSIVTLNLTISRLDVSVVVQDEQLIATQTNATYQWIDCDSEQPIEDETSMIYSPQNSGTYAVEISNDFCVFLSDCYEITIATMQIKQSEVGIELMIYPNPANDFIYVQFEGIADLEIIDVAGKQIYFNRHHGDVSIVNLNKIEAGIYFVQLIMDGNTLTKKIIVQ